MSVITSLIHLFIQELIFFEYLLHSGSCARPLEHKRKQRRQRQLTSQEAYILGGARAIF